MCARDQIQNNDDVKVDLKKTNVKPDLVRQIEEEKLRRVEANSKSNDGHHHQQGVYIVDFLALLTQLSKVIYDKLNVLFQKFQKTNSYTVLTKTTQPIHAIIGLAVCMIWLCFRTNPDESYIRPWKLLYVGSVAVHLGAQFWMTFVSGIVLYFNLPRHVFGNVQTVLFPVYYTFNACISFLSLLSFIKIQHVNNNLSHTSIVQIALMSAVLLIEASVRLYLVRPMLKLKYIKTQIEKAAGAGQEVGKLILNDLAKCPHYMKILRGFRRFHSMIAMGTVITFGCSVYNLMILVDSLCVPQ